MATISTHRIAWFLIGILATATAATRSDEPSSATGAKTANSSAGVAGLPSVTSLSADTTSYLYRMGWTELQELLKNGLAMRTITSPGVQSFLNEFHRVTHRPGESNALCRLMVDALREDIVIAGGPAGPKQASSSTTQPADGEEESWCRMAIVRPSAGFAEQLRKDCDTMRQLARTENGNEKKRSAGSLEFEALTPGDEDVLFGAWKDQTFYWGVGPCSAERLGRPVEGKSLDQSPMFQATVGPIMAGQPAKPIAMYYYDLRSKWADLSKGSDAAFWDSLSWRSLDGVAAATFVEDFEYHHRYYWKIGEQRRGLFKHTQTSRINQDWLWRIPADASGFTTGVWDANSFFKSAAVLLLTVLSGGEASDQAVAQATAADMALKQLLDPVGSRYLVYRVPGKYGSFPMANALPIQDIVVVAELNDTKAFQTALDELAAEAPAGGDTTVAGHPVKVINLYYVACYLAVLNKEVMFTFNAQLLKDALENWNRPPATSIMDTPAYKEAAKHLLPDTCFELYLPPGGFSRGICDQYLPVLQQMIMLGQAFGGGGKRPSDPATRGFDPITLPRGADLIAGATRATILSARDDGEGVIFEGRAPILCTPYYWTYLHAFTQLNPEGGRGAMEMLLSLFIPTETSGDASSDAASSSESEGQAISTRERKERYKRVTSENAATHPSTDRVIIVE